MLLEWSQSFIHQVRILSAYIKSLDVEESFPNVAILYSSSQNSLQKSGKQKDRGMGVAILYSSSQNSLSLLNDKGIYIEWAERCRNPLFIKSEFSLDNPGSLACLDYPGGIRGEVAILYSSSQNSLCKKVYPDDAPIVWSGRNPLFIKSEFSRHLRNPLPCMG